ncbi:MAG: hypothetical protein AB1791_19775 [Chloroflexota bacterium]
MLQHGNEVCPFCAILNGEQPGDVLARDDARRFALIKSIHPEGAIHWLAIPFEHIHSTRDMERASRERFLELVEFALAQTQARVEEYPTLEQGFTIKLHFGSYETIPHAKLHVLSIE